MRTQVISLHPHDDLISVRDKLGWARTPRILLVWPLRGRVDLRPLDLKLLQRHASGLGAQLGLVTRSEEMIRAAHALDIPVFSMASEAQRVAWPPRRPALHPPQRAPRKDLRAQAEQVKARQPGWLMHPAVRLLFFSLGVLAVLAVGVLFIPRAEIRLAFPSREQAVELEAAASPDFSSVGLTGRLPASQVTLTLEGSETTSVTSRVSLPDKKAAGVVQFRNLTESAVPVPAGMVVQTLDAAPRRYVTTQAGEVPAGFGKTLELPVEALQPGTAGNCPAESIQAVGGAPGLSLTVVNPKAVSGGRDQTLPGPSLTDRQRIRERLLASLSEQALNQAAAENDGLVLPGTLQLEVLEESTDPPPGQPGVNLTLHMRVSAKIQYVASADLGQLGRSVLDAQLEPNAVAVSYALDWKTLSEPFTAPDGLTSFRLRLSRRVWQPVSPVRVIQLVQGRRTESAIQRLEESLSLAAPPQVDLWPGWWPWLPLASTRTSVSFEFP